MGGRTALRLIGAIVRLQVQQASLKVGRRPWQRYDPSPLVPVPALTISAGGVIGHAAGEAVMDVHHREHPATKNRRGRNAISLGFTGHYAAMRTRFGAHLADGLAGENILIASDGLVDEEAVQGGLLIETAGGWVRLEEVRVAEPCAPFSRYALQRQTTGTALSETLDFLRRGLRGYYAVYHGPAVRLQVGEQVFATSDSAEC